MQLCLNTSACLQQNIVSNWKNQLNRRRYLAEGQTDWAFETRTKHKTLYPNFLGYTNSLPSSEPPVHIPLPLSWGPTMTVNMCPKKTQTEEAVIC